jgi:DNA-binding NtrC family response regulator
VTYVLRVVGEGVLALFPLPEAGEVSIGRGSGANLQIDAPSIAREHARLSIGARVRIKALAPTRVGDRAVAPGAWSDVAPGDVIDVGEVMLILLRREAGTAKDGDAMARAERLLERIAPYELGVLIHGETGVGKEVFAERLHARSPRAARPLLRASCGGFTDAQLESALFDRLGSARGGTVFLDEVGELSPALQARLLRALKDRAIDVRWIAATSRDLHAAVAAGRFERELLDVLAGVTLEIPPLRERAEDIAKLARAFLAEASRRSGRALRLTHSAIARLEQHRWPGNVRELKNAIDSAALIAQGDQVDAAHLAIHAPAPDVDAREKQRIVAALEACGGNQTRAATALGISRGTLLARIKQYGIKRPRS